MYSSFITEILANILSFILLLYFTFFSFVYIGCLLSIGTLWLLLCCTPNNKSFLFCVCVRACMCACMCLFSYYTDSRKEEQKYTHFIAYTLFYTIMYDIYDVQYIPEIIYWYVVFWWWWVNVYYLFMMLMCTIMNAINYTTHWSELSLTPIHNFI